MAETIFRLRLEVNNPDKSVIYIRALDRARTVFSNSVGAGYWQRYFARGSTNQDSRTRKPDKGTIVEISPVTLEGQHVRLEPLSQAHEEALIAAASDGEL